MEYLSVGNFLSVELNIGFNDVITSKMVFIVKYSSSKTIEVNSFSDIKDNCIYLNCNLNNLTSLEGIERLKKIKILDISNNHLNSLEPIVIFKTITRIIY